MWQLECVDGVSNALAGAVKRIMCKKYCTVNFVAVHHMRMVEAYLYCPEFLFG